MRRSRFTSPSVLSDEITAALILEHRARWAASPLMRWIRENPGGSYKYENIVAGYRRAAIRYKVAVTLQQYFQAFRIPESVMEKAAEDAREKLHTAQKQLYESFAASPDAALSKLFDMRDKSAAEVAHKEIDAAVASATEELGKRLKEMIARNGRHGIFPPETGEAGLRR